MFLDVHLYGITLGNRNSTKAVTNGIQRMSKGFMLLRQIRHKYIKKGTTENSRGLDVERS